MSKINKIQNALRELEGGVFQKLVDSYLHRKGYEKINSIGSVIGSDKVRKGTPDTLVPTENGMYIFCEYTTISQNKVFDKFNEDIDKCVDEQKTKIPVSKIKEIVLCCTSELSTDEIEKLRNKCQNLKINLNLFGISTISYDLLEKYPGIAKDYLGINVDTGQIISLERFISFYEKNKFATTLKTSFHFREQEVNYLSEKFSNWDLLIISGRTGVGKTRFAIECFNKLLNENKSYKAYCIFNQGIDIFEDVRSYFSDAGEYLIFVDDANRVSGFNYFCNLLLTKRDDQNIKIILTVRDYATDKIIDTCKSKSVSKVEKINIELFSDQEIETIIKNEFEINNPAYLDRIVNLAKGNPRIAVMAANIAKQNNSLNSISDVSELYNEYYSSIKSDIELLKNDEIIKVAGIISFYRTIDITNDSLMNEIENVFGIFSKDFWNFSKQLHNMEIVDMFENEVVKISDQVLSTYLFFYVFIERRLINYFLLLTHLFLKHKQKIKDSLYPVLNAFGFGKVSECLEEPVSEIWKKMSEKTDKKDFFHLIDVFWVFKQTETLNIIKKQIDNLDKQQIVDINEIKFEEGSNSSIPSLISLLPHYINTKKENFEISVELLLYYAEKKLLNTPSILKCVISEYGFKPDSFQFNYMIQITVVNSILKKCDESNNEYFNRLFIYVAKKYLQTHFSSGKSGRNYTFTITNFKLYSTDALLNLRRTMLTHLFYLYQYKEYRIHLIKLFLEYSQYGLEVPERTIIESDSALIIPFLENQFDSEDLMCCIVMQKYFKLLDDLNIQYDKTIKQKFKSSYFLLYDYFSNKFERVELRFAQADFHEYKIKAIEKITNTYSEMEYELFFQQIANVMPQFKDREEWQIINGLSYVFLSLLNNNENLFKKVLIKYLNEKEYLNITPGSIISNMVKMLGASNTFKIIESSNYHSKNTWLFCFYSSLSEPEIDEHYIDGLLGLYRESKFKYFINNMDFLLKYEEKRAGIVRDVVKILLKRTKDNSIFANSLRLIFNEYTDIYKQLDTLFNNHFDLLENTYMAIDNVDNHADYKGIIFLKLINNDNSFIDRFFSSKVKRKKYTSLQSDRRYCSIWKHDDFMQIMRRISEIFFENKNYYSPFLELEAFFDKKESNEEILEKQDSFLKQEIEDNIDSKDYLFNLFYIIAQLSSERKLQFYELLLSKNKKFDFFKEIPFFNMIGVYEGSMIPTLQNKINFLEDVIKLCNSVDLLEHKMFLESLMKNIRQEIAREKKKDFTEML